MDGFVEQSAEITISLKRKCSPEAMRFIADRFAVTVASELKPLAEAAPGLDMKVQMVAPKITAPSEPIDTEGGA
jgi:hypothetical protein